MVHLHMLWLPIVTRCPVNGLPDVLWAEVSTSSMIDLYVVRERCFGGLFMRKIFMEDVANEVLKRAPDRSDARIGAGRAALALGRLPELAEAWMPVRAQLSPEDTRELARANLRNGNAEDARMCVEHGADAIIVSNHGGRSLDYDPVSNTVRGDEEATRLLRRPYRAPWKHPADA